jgi:hypothetical protein
VLHRLGDIAVEFEVAPLKDTSRGQLDAVGGKAALELVPDPSSDKEFASVPGSSWT